MLGRRKERVLRSVAVIFYQKTKNGGFLRVCRFFWRSPWVYVKLFVKYCVYYIVFIGFVPVFFVGGTCVHKFLWV